MNRQEKYTKKNKADLDDSMLGTIFELICERCLCQIHFGNFERFVCALAFFCHFFWKLPWYYSTVLVEKNGERNRRPQFLAKDLEITMSNGVP
jgi:hypothetical protein